MTNLNRDTILTDRARELYERVCSRAEQTERDRCVPTETVEELKAAGLFRAFQPKRYSGLEATPADFFGAVIELGSACPSTAWILAIMGIHMFELARMSPELQDEVLSDEPDTLVSSSYSPQGIALPVPGGFRLNGHWKSSSGVDHATWVVLGGSSPPLNDGEKSVPRIFYVPLSDARTVDDWFVMGLGGTGSKSVILEDVFVPEHRTMTRAELAQGPGLSLNTAPLFRLPQGLMYLLPGSAPAIGAGKGALREYTGQVKARTKPRLDGSMLLEDPLVLRRLAVAKFDIDSAEARLMFDMREMMDTVASGQEVSPNAVARYSWDYSRAADDCVDAVRAIFETLGASVVYSSNPLQRFYRDVLTMRQHGTQDPDRGALAVARGELGLPGPPGRF